MSVRLAIDIGGTFTDATLIDEETGEVSIAKVLTTPADPSEGFMQAVERALAEGGVGAGEVTLRRPRDDGRDERDHRGEDRAQRLRHDRGVPRPARDRAAGAADALRHAVREGEAARARATARSSSPSGSGPKGEVLRPLEDDSVRDAAAILRREEVESVAVCLLHAYVNAEHERRVGEILAEELPGIPISLSSEVAPEFREYLRASTTVINAVIRPGRRALPQRIESRLAGGGRAGEAARDAVERRHLRLGCRRRAAGVHGRVGPGGRA